MDDTVQVITGTTMDECWVIGTPLSSLYGFNSVSKLLG